MKLGKQRENAFYKWEVLILLWFAFWFNQADRQLYNTLLEKISDSLSMTSAEAGLVATVFCWVLAICFPLAGFAADRFSKKWIICGSVFLWSAATMISGGAAGFLMFIIFRSIATGVGEGCFAPSNYATICDYHDSDTRATAMSIYTTSQYFGIIVSGIIAGWIGDNYGWRPAFYIFGSVGVILAFIIMWRLKDKVHVGVSPSAKARNAPSAWESIKVFFSVPSAVLLTLCFSGVIFVVQGYLTWSTLFLQEKFAMNNVEAGFNSVFYAHIGSFVGILLAGRLSDNLAARKPKYRVLLQSLGYLLASPFIVLMGLGEELLVVFIGFVGFGFFRGFYDSNIYVTLYDVIPEKYRGSAAGIMLFIGFILGSFAPWILGVMKPIFGLSHGIAMLSTVWIFFGLVLMFIYKFLYERDYAKAAEANKNSF